MIQKEPQNTGLCKADQYYSDHTKSCETAVLQLGAGEHIFSLTIEELKEKYPLQEIRVPENPAYDANPTGANERRYLGFPLKTILNDLLPEGERLSDYLLAVTCLDGYDPVFSQSTMAKLNEYEAIVAIEEITTDREGAELTKDERWEKLHLEWGIVSPGPFYILWNNTEGILPSDWPFQIKSIRLVKAVHYEAMLEKLKPSAEFMGQTPISEIEEGYNQFRGKCLTCHSLNSVGGNKANIDLIDRFRLFNKKSSLPYLKAIIRNPSAGMTEIKDLIITDEDIVKLNAYLSHKAKN